MQNLKNKNNINKIKKRKTKILQKKTLTHSKHFVDYKKTKLTIAIQTLIYNKNNNIIILLL